MQFISHGSIGARPGAILRARLLGEIVGAHDEPREPGLRRPGRGGDFAGIEHAPAASPSWPRPVRLDRRLMSTQPLGRHPRAAPASSSSAPAPRRAWPCATAVRSSTHQGVSRPLMRTIDLAARRSRRRRRHRATCVRAAALASGATESSRSRITRVDRQRARLLDRAGVRSRHVEHAAARTDVHGEASE